LTASNDQAVGAQAEAIETHVDFARSVRAAAVGPAKDLHPSIVREPPSPHFTVIHCIPLFFS
jgi:hypothetical protein